MPQFSLAKIPWYAQVGAFVALSVGAMAGFYFYYEQPLRVDLDAREARLKILQADISKGLATANKLGQFRAQVGDLEARLETLRAVLPEEKDVADLVRRLQTVATQSNITIKGVKPQATITKQMHAEWPIQLDLDGTYHNLALFFDRVGRFTRIVNISGLDIKGKPAPDVNSTITASCTATTFVLLADKDKPKPVAPPAPPAAKGAD